MSKRMLSKLRQAIVGFSRKCVLPIGLAIIFFAPNCVYAFNAETNEWKNVQIYGGGMITGIRFSEAEENLAYARTDMGGIYRWQEDSQSWKPLTDFVGPEIWSNLGCDSIATDPTDPNRVYALMGEYDNGWTSVHGAVFCSNDKGETWDVVELPFFCGSNMPGRLTGERLVVDPNKNSNLYIASRNDGLWKSEDYGRTWKEVKSFPTKGTFKYDNYAQGESSVGVTWVIPDKNSNKQGSGSQTIYVGVADREHSIYRSKDGGLTWQPLPNEPRGKVTNEETGAWQMEAGETYLPWQSYLTKEGILYVAYSTKPGLNETSYGDVWKYNTKTDKWTLISPKSSKGAPDDVWYSYNGMAVDPQNENNIVVICQSWWPDALMYRSTDGGATWTNAWEWIGYPDRKFYYKMDISAAPWLDWGTTGQLPGSAEVSPKLGWYVGAIDIDPFNSDRLMYGTGATLYGTNNLTNWDKGGQIDITVMAAGIEQTVSNALVVIPGPGDGLVSSLYDINGFYHEDVTKVPDILANVKKDDKYGTLNSSVSLDYAELNPSIVVRVGARTAIDTYGSYLNGMMWSKDGGKTFSPISSRIGESEGKGKVALAADGGIVVWATPDEPVSWSSGGYNWTASKGIPTGARVVSDRANSKVFYGYKAGKAYVSMDGAKTFEAVTVPGLPSVVDMNIKAVRGHEGHVWMGTAKAEDKTQNGFWFSQDYGKTYTKLISVDAVNSFGFGKGKEGSSYEAIYITGQVEGQQGFFRSDDQGESWTRINDDDHQYGLVDPGCDVTGDPDVYGRVYIGTNGRGIVYADTGNDTPMLNSSITPKAATFDKKAELQADISVDVAYNGNKLLGIKNGGTVLTEGTDYVVEGNKVTILKGYLETLANGTAQLTFDFNNGQDATLSITVKETINSASLSIVKATFDKKVELQKDITLDIVPNGNALLGIKNGDKVLTAGVDYVVEGNKVTILKGYLAQQTANEVALIFDFNKGEDPVLTITMTNTINQAELVERSGEVDLANPQNLDVNMKLNGTTLKGISVDGKALTPGANYQVNGEKVTLLADYLKTLAKGTTTFIFEFSEGDTQSFVVTVKDTTVVNPPVDPVDPVDPVTNAINVSLTSTGGPSTNTIGSVFKLKVADNQSFDVSKLSIRYYFTADDASMKQSLWVDHAAMQFARAPWYMSVTEQVNHQIVKMTQPKVGADTYVELTFTSSEVLDAKGELQIATRIANENWSNFDQSNDYSYNNAEHVAVFYNGELVSGSIPR